MSPESQRYIEVLQRERELVVKCHDLETRLAAEKMTSTNAERREGYARKELDELKAKLDELRASMQSILQFVENLKGDK